MSNKKTLEDHEINVKKDAIEHTIDMKNIYSDEIEDRANRSIIYPNDTKEYVEYKNDCKLAIRKIDIVKDDVIHYIFSNDIGEHAAVLNFSSYMTPGGGFLNGAIAQEESLCHFSYLYNVLKGNTSYYDYNRNHLNLGFYETRALYTPDIRFIDISGSKFIDVISCAAPNLTAYAMMTENIMDPENYNHIELVSRIELIMKIASIHKIDTLILGAWGCGVFRQNPEEVSKAFIEVLDKLEDTVFHVVFVIPGGKNYDVFNETIKEYLSTRGTNE